MVIYRLSPLLRLFGYNFGNYSASKLRHQRRLSLELNFIILDIQEDAAVVVPGVIKMPYFGLPLDGAVA